MHGSFSKLPGGNIAPARFVKLDTTPGQAVQAGANDPPWGISQPAVRRLALAGWDDGFAGILGDGAINIFGPGDDECLLELGGTVTYGQRLKSDASGKGVAATADADRVGAIALSNGSAGQLIKVKPLRYDIS